MNARRVAEILRERARLDIELAEAIEDGDTEAPTSPQAPKRRSRARAFPAPLGKPSDTDRAAARRTLQRRGIST